MYNETIDTSNKIITNEDLQEIFAKINEEMVNIENLSKEEKIRNQNVDTENQTWAYKNYSATFKCTFNFYDSTTITVDNYDGFINLYNDRLSEIKDMWVRCSLWYSHGIGYHTDQITNHISLNIYNHKMDIETSLSSSDIHLNGVYELIKDKILNAPERYDNIIKNKSKISNVIGFSIGMIPSLIICTLLAIIPIVRQIYGMTYVLYPIIALVFGFLIGNTLFRGKIDGLYKYIEPEKKYAGYDTTNYKSIYKDDLEDYTKKSEILIGKNINNLNIRKQINELYEKYNKYLPIELLITVGLSIIMIVLGKLL